LRIILDRQGSNNILRPVCKKKTFFSILPQSFRTLVQNFQKLQIGPQKNIRKKYQKGYQKTKNFMLSTKLFAHNFFCLLFLVILSTDLKSA